MTSDPHAVRYLGVMKRMIKLAPTLVLCLLFSCAPDTGEIRIDPVPDRYQFLFGAMVKKADLPAVRDQLPYDRITFERPGSYWSHGTAISLYRDGRAVLQENGVKEGAVSIFDYGRLCYLAERIQIETLEPRYAWDGYDGEWERVKVWPAGSEEAVVVEDYGGCGPIELWALQTAIEGVAGRIKWKDTATKK